MSDKVYRFYRFKWKPEWFTLSEEERERRLAEVSAKFQQAGIVNVLGDFVYSCWSSEWTAFGVEEYESLEAVQRWRDEMEKMGWFEFVDMETMVGIQMTSD